MIHMAGKNMTSDRQRRALGFIYYGEECEVDEVAHAAYQTSIVTQWAKEGRT
jgi:phytanoyl-CoA hydroxylase